MNMYESMAQAMPKLVRLECNECGRRKPIDERQAAISLREGWPKCCGYTMELITEDTTQECSASPPSERSVSR